MVEINCDFGEYEKEISERIMTNIQKVCDQVLRSEGYKGSFEISLSFVNNEEIQQINAEHRGIDKKTDVLSFPMYEKEELAEIDSAGAFPILLGDIIVSVPTAREQAESFNHSLNREISFLVCHSMLHLLGYDHMTAEEAAEMETKQKHILNKLEITRAD